MAIPVRVSGGGGTGLNAGFLPIADDITLTEVSSEFFHGQDQLYDVDANDGSYFEIANESISYFNSSGVSQWSLGVNLLGSNADDVIGIYQDPVNTDRLYTIVIDWGLGNLYYRYITVSTGAVTALQTYTGVAPTNNVTYLGGMSPLADGSLHVVIHSEGISTTDCIILNLDPSSTTVNYNYTVNRRLADFGFGTKNVFRLPGYMTADGQYGVGTVGFSSNGYVVLSGLTTGFDVEANINFSDVILSSDNFDPKTFYPAAGNSIRQIQNTDIPIQGYRPIVMGDYIELYQWTASSSFYRAAKPPMGSLLFKRTDFDAFIVSVAQELGV